MKAGKLTGVMVGAGYFASFQAEAWCRIAGAKIVAVADTNEVKAREFAARWGIPRVYAEAERMLAAEQPDFADIVTRPDIHRELTELAAHHGVAVICQKPMAPSAIDSVAMVECCERAGVRLLIHENWRWQPWYREASRVIASAALGRIFQVSFHMRTGDGRGPEPYPAQPYFHGMPRFLIFETLVHFLDTFPFLAGEIRSVTCRTARVNPVIAGEDSALIQMEFASGAGGLIDANRVSGPKPPDLTFGTLCIEGDRGTLHMTTDGRLWITEYGGNEREHEYVLPQTGFKGDSVKALQEHLVQCLRSGQQAESEGRLYLKTVNVVEACYESAEKGVPVRLPKQCGEL